MRASTTRSRTTTAAADDRTQSLNIVIIGLSITSSWGNGHATTYRGLVRGLDARGHRVLFLERNQPWYADNRDMPRPPYGRAELYESLDELKDRFAEQVRQADLVVVGSYVDQGIAVGRWVVETAEGVTAFYDIDTPVTLAKLEQGECAYINPELIRRYRMYLSFTGGPTLELLERGYGSRMARPLYCSVDPRLYHPKPAPRRWELGYLGTYSDDRQPTVDRLLRTPARQWPEGRFVVAGPQYPESIEWPANVERIVHLNPSEHCTFYNSQAYTLNVTRADMIRAGYSPSVRLFEAGACGVPIISDYWKGLETFLEPGREILIAHDTDDVLRFLRDTRPSERAAIVQRAMRKVLSGHTAAHRARELERYALLTMSEATAR